jgi:hypothetical protein
VEEEKVVEDNTEKERNGDFEYYNRKFETWMKGLDITEIVLFVG